MIETSKLLKARKSYKRLMNFLSSALLSYFFTTILEYFGYIPSEPWFFSISIKVIVFVVASIMTTLAFGW